MSTTNNADEIKVDDRKALRLLKKVLIKESANLKSKELSEKDMIKFIQDKIKEEVECY